MLTHLMPDTDPEASRTAASRSFDDSIEVAAARDDHRTVVARLPNVVDCLICAKHRGEGPLAGQLVVRADGFWVYHAPADDTGRAPLGYLFIESDRHAPDVSSLSDEEAALLGRLRSRLARALRETLDPERVFAFVIGTRVAHFHEHLVTRHRGTPVDVPFYDSDEAAPRADEDEVASLVLRLTTILSDGDPG